MEAAGTPQTVGSLAEVDTGLAVADNLVVADSLDPVGSLEAVDTLADIRPAEEADSHPVAADIGSVHKEGLGFGQGHDSLVEVDIV